ncbi:hypothetical protein PFLUV_G00089870 [Perca fluviatilis]|uniref:Uncharacterized protein n=1 Tax=Perca fluviatilis TaxID=8168 RepID=A0A6A5FAI6_PERFL|nr:hypothetical protein PFLUV_G00089870 [Perca fluviatilis]
MRPAEACHSDRSIDRRPGGGYSRNVTEALHLKNICPEDSSLILSWWFPLALQKRVTPRCVLLPGECSEDG